MMTNHCPFCGSTDISRSGKNLAGNIAKETFGGAAGALTAVPSLILTAMGIPVGVPKKLVVGVHDALVGDTLTKQYKCHSCGRVFTETIKAPCSR